MERKMYSDINRLEPELIKKYKEEGFLLVPSLISKEDLIILDVTIRNIVKDAENNETITQVIEYENIQIDGLCLPRRLFNPFELHEQFRRIATSEQVLGYVISLIGQDIALQHSKLNMKPQKVGAVVEWHQDFTYFPHTNDDLVGVLIYLDDATSENGCLEVLPRQHTRSFDHSLPDGSFAGMITEEINEENYGQPVTLAAKAGSTIFLHPFTPHRSAPNVSEKPRKTLIFEYRATDAFPIYTGSQLVSMESYVHHLHGNPATHARFGGPPPAIYTPKDIPKSLYELQEVSRKILKPEE
ncbi:phytanoyl-CoA dioxygenase family protein [Photorhabdus noenieputensis]|nr:phytanoyl-CoA dioxygenase family protein [Photorhabdus noenieputensis]